MFALSIALAGLAALHRRQSSLEIYRASHVVNHAADTPLAPA
ncbi:hypothetical protein HMPREF0758_1865 [Serratia odorifera DSM 4582]|uniref:Uncharacterized protein n=1 Tax=Serratia odorifera DSM 4582 TaxID=667129 RepID=D4E191_SEROD|nr:hypothetical protein HMPREF0758_1865 [Serratia odorifera DSM 4582]